MESPNSVQHPIFTVMDMNYNDDENEELEIIEALEKGTAVRSGNFQERKRTLRMVAENTFRKDARINIRLSSQDLDGLKIKAIEEGIPYQTLISSILHKYVSGKLRSM